MGDLRVVSSAPATDTRDVPQSDINAPESAPLMRELLGATLRSARLRQERTLKDVADRAGVSMTYLSEVERGRKEASSEVVGAVTRALGGDLIDLLTEMTALAVPAIAAKPTDGGRIRAVA